MTFNIGGDEWGGWTHKPGSPYTAPYMTDVENAIRASGADVVGIQEPFGRMHELASALGWYDSPRLYILSRFSIVQPQAGGGVAFFAHIGGFLFGVLTVRLVAIRRPLMPKY